MKNKKSIIIIISLITLIALVALLVYFIFYSKTLDHSMVPDTSAESLENSPDNLTISKVLKENDKDNIFYVSSEYSLGVEPTLDYLYKSSDIIIIGTFENDSISYVSEGTIRTKTTFNTIQVLKNESNTDVNGSVTFERLGGVMLLDDFLKDNIAVREDEFTNIDKTARANYYVFQEFAPNNQLDFASMEENKEYLLFLSYSDGVLMPNSVHYGIREISNNKVYDYDKATYINSNIIKNDVEQ